MNDATSSKIAILSRELEAAFRNRADLYRLLLDELEASLGVDAAEAALIRVLERRGREVAAIAFARFGPRDAVKIGEAFLAVSPDGGKMYPTDVERGEHRISFKVKRCPLKDAWVDAGVGSDGLSKLCRIAGAFDRGLFEATGIKFSNTTWSPDHSLGCCRITLEDRDCSDESRV